MKYLGPITDEKDIVNKGYVDGGLASKVSTSDYAPVAKTADMTQAVGKDADGQLWTEPGVEINLGITGASVGQVATVKTVDGNGRPTKWGATNEKFELINRITTTEEVTRVTITADLDGASFDLTKVFAIYLPPETVAAANLLVFLDYNNSTRLGTFYQPGQSFLSSGGSWFASKEAFWTGYGARISGNGSTTQIYYSNAAYNRDASIRACNVRMVTFLQNINFPTGSIFEVWGVRA